MKRCYRLNLLDLENQLLELGYKPNYVKKHSWKYDVFITKILFKHIFMPNKNYISLSHDELENQLGRIKLKGKVDRAYSIIRKDLKKLGILQFNPTGTSDFINHIYKRKTFYKIREEILSGGWRQVDYPITDAMKEKMSRVKEYTGIYGKLRDNLIQISIDKKEALDYCDFMLNNEIQLKPKMKNFRWVKRKMNVKSYSSWVMLIYQIVDGEYKFHVDMKSTNRVYHFLTSLPKDLRKFVRINNQPIFEIDIKNCQPLLFNTQILEYLKLNSLNPTLDIEHYKSLCEDGEFYNYMKGVIPDELLNELQEQNNSIFKADFFGRVFFSTEKKHYKWRAIFDTHFPMVSKIITYYKKNCYKDLPVQLQRIESEIMINQVSRNLINLNCNEFFTLHDAIYCTEDIIDVVQSEILGAMKNVGLNPSFKTKRLVCENELLAA